MSAPKSEKSEQSVSGTLLGHPKGLFVLFFTEMWERFSFYGMRFIMFLFLMDDVVRGGFGWSKGAAYALYGLYTMSVYLANVPGGWLADRYLGKKRAVLWGGIAQCIGHFLLALKHQGAFLLGLVALVIGTGLLKSNISALLGSLYPTGSAQKERGFSIFYMGINIGAMLAGFIVTTVAQKCGWHYGFSLAGVGMLVGLAGYLVFSGSVPNVEEEELAKGGGRRVIGVAGLVVLGMALVYGLLHFTGWMDKFLVFVQGHFYMITNILAGGIGLAVLAYMRYIVSKMEDRKERDRMVALGLGMLLIFVFFVCFEQAGGLMTEYTDKHTDLSFLGLKLPSTGIQNLNSIFVVLFSVLISMGWTALKRGRSSWINATFQMSVGNIIMGLGFLFMIGASLQRISLGVGGKSSLYWLVGAYFFHTIGELCLSPVLLSFTSNMAPKKMGSLMMGITFAVMGLSNHFAAQLGALSEGYGERTIFQIACYAPIILGILFLLFNKYVIGLTHGAEEVDKKTK